jgi:hypothetical protein
MIDVEPRITRMDTDGRLQVVPCTSRSSLTSAEICRHNAWGAGTRLIGEPLPKEVDRRPRKIQITALGLRAILAVQIEPEELPEQAWCLKTRDWSEDR